MYVEVARADVSLSALVGIHNELIVGMIDELGSEEQKARWLPGLTAFTQLGAFALTEPDHGSDIAGGLATTARLEGGEWVINGAKRWIGAGTIADFALVWARDVADQQIKGFIVETDRPGYTATKIANKIGLRIMQNADIVLDEVRIPASNLLPGATDFSKANELLRDSRAWVGWQAAGIQLAAFDVARAYSLQRKQFGKELARFQLIQQQLAEILGNATASLALMAQLARIQEDGKLEMVQAAMAKSTTTRLARASVAMGRSLHGRERHQQRLRDGQALRRRRNPLHLRGQLRDQFTDRGPGRDGKVGLRLGSPHALGSRSASRVLSLLPGGRIGVAVPGRAVAAAVLGLVQGPVRAVQEGSGRGVALLADAGRDRQETDVPERFGRDGLAGPFGGAQGLGAVGLREQPHELLAAEPGHDLLGAGDLPEPRGDLCQDDVAHQVAIGVVDPLEVVDIQDHGTQARSRGSRPAQPVRRGAVPGPAGWAGRSGHRSWPAAPGPVRASVLPMAISTSSANWASRSIMASVTPVRDFEVRLTAPHRLPRTRIGAAAADWKPPARICSAACPPSGR